MTIELTEAAAQHLRRELTKRGHGTGLRVATKKSGGTGFVHVVDCADDISIDDQVFESQDVQVVADKQSLPNLDGLVIDFVKTNLLTGTGQLLLADAVKRTFTVSDNTAIDAVVVDAISQQAET